MSISFLLFLAFVAVITGPGPVWACVVLSVAILALIGFLEWLDRNRAPGILECLNHNRD
jgi:hypothetical protein